MTANPLPLVLGADTATGAVVARNNGPDLEVAGRTIPAGAIELVRLSDLAAPEHTDPPAPRLRGVPVRSIAITTPEGTPPCA